MDGQAVEGPSARRAAARGVRSERKLLERLTRVRGTLLVRRAQLILAETSGRKVGRRRRRLADALVDVARAESALAEAGFAVPPEPVLLPALGSPASSPEPPAQPVAQPLAQPSVPATPSERAGLSVPGPVAPSASLRPSAPSSRGAGAESPVRRAARLAAREAAEALVGPSASLTGEAGELAGAPTVAAAVDVGANSVHLLVAVTGGHRLEPLVDESVFLGLGDAVERGWLGPELRRGLVDALARYAGTARRLGADHIVLMGTEPLRRAADAARVVHDVATSIGLPLHVLSHEEEGYLTLIGATGGRPAVREVLVVDVGGGSSELVFVGADRGHVAVGLRIGSARLTATAVEHDPPTADEVTSLRELARERVAEAPAERPTEIIAVGGTASNLVKVLPAAVLDRTLSRSRLVEALAALTADPSALVAEHHAIRPERARILAAGAAILLAVLERYGLERLLVSEEGIREGAVLAAGVAGDAWRDRLPRLVEGWRGA